MMDLPAGVRMVKAGNPSAMTLDGTRTFVVGSTQPAVIDPGPDDPAHLGAVLRLLAGVVPVVVLTTHAHPDHAAGARAISRATTAPVLHPADGELTATDAGELQAVATPGHTPDHFCFLFNSSRGRVVFVGDLLMGEGYTTLVAPPEGNLHDYLASLERIRRLDPVLLLPAHGPPIRAPDKALTSYRRHREERIGQLRAVLERRPGPARPGELVDEVYGELDPRLRAAAVGSLEAVLAYLARSGEASEEDGRWRPRA
ncbi:MAG: MBL fold metallo-hydrolase [Longimicrobiaceae bacterium]